MSWLSKVSNWLFSANSGFGKSENQEEQVAGQGRSQIRLKLEKRQQALASEIERTFRAYDEKLSVLAETLRALDDQTLKKQAKALEKSQDELQRIIRRLEAAVKSTQDLERELAEWENREVEDSRQDDYTEAVKEIIRSELTMRGMKRAVVRPAPTIRPMIAEQLDESRIQMPVSCFESSNVQSIPISELSQEDLGEKTREYLSDVEEDYLIQAIREATREAERWHGVPDGENDEEAALQVRHVRDLNAALKIIDRKNGISRDRMALAVRIRP